MVANDFIFEIFKYMGVENRERMRLVSRNFNYIFLHSFKCQIAYPNLRVYIQLMPDKFHIVVCHENDRIEHYGWDKCSNICGGEDGEHSLCENRMYERKYKNEWKNYMDIDTFKNHPLFQLMKKGYLKIAYMEWTMTREGVEKFLE